MHMKQIAALILLAALILGAPAPSALAVLNLPQGVAIPNQESSASTPASTPAPSSGTSSGTSPSATGSDLGGSSDTAVSGETGTSGSGKEATPGNIASDMQCGDPNSGGSLQSLIQRYGGEELDGVIEGLGGRGSYGELLQGLFSGEGTEGLSSLFQDTGFSDWFGAAGGLFGGEGGISSTDFGDLGSIFGGSGSGSGSEGGGFDFGSIINGDGGFDIGSVAGIAGGGGRSVPTDDSKTRKKIDERISETNELATQINEKQAVQVDLECITRPTLATLVGQQQDQVISEILKVAAEQQAVDPAGDIATARQAGAEKFIDSLSSDRDRALATQWVTQAVSGRSPVDCSSGNIFERILKQSQYSECTRGGADAELFGRLRAEVEESEQAYRDLLEAGSKPRGTCTNGKGEDAARCPKDFQVDESGQSIEALKQRALQQVLDKDADSLGETVQDEVANLFKRITEKIEDAAQRGLQGIVSGRSEGSSGRGSYLNQIISGGGGPTVRQGKNIFVQNINDSMKIEAEFQDIQRESIAALQKTSTMFETIKACYAAHAAHPPVNLTVADALAAVNNSSTTIKVLTENIAERRTLIRRSEDAVRDLDVILAQARATNEPEELNALAETYNALRSAGRIHTTGELRFAAEDMATLVEGMLAAQADAQVQIDGCRSYGG